MKNNIIVVGLIIVGAVIGVYALSGEQNERESVGTESDMIRYDSSERGVRFFYPVNYFLEERELIDAYRKHFAVILTDDTEENRLVREGLSPGREGPVAITLDFYQNPEGLSALEWVLGNSFSNYKLGDSSYEEIILANKSAVSYSWDGLYPADSVILLHEGYVVSITVTHLTPGDQIRKDLAEILDSISFY